MLQCWDVKYKTVAMLFNFTYLLFKFRCEEKEQDLLRTINLFISKLKLI